MTRKTSRESYGHLKSSGLLSQRRWETYDTLFNHGPLTGQEVSRVGGRPGLWKRCSELEAMGLAEAIGERICSVTGRNAVIWDVTDRRDPLELPKTHHARQDCPHCNGKGWLRATPEDASKLIHDDRQVEMFPGVQP